jgi:hypothetical protein
MSEATKKFVCPDECCVLLDDSRFDGFVDIHVNNVPYQSVIIFSAFCFFQNQKKWEILGNHFFF